MNDRPLQSGTGPDHRDANALYFVPLGGAGEIGMNLNVYGYEGHWLIIDCGVTFGDDSQPGLEVVMPDPRFIVERRDRLLGILATHAHEDHIGAIPYLWKQLRCPIWATPFTASLVRAKLAEAGLGDQVKIHIVPLSSRFTIGPFDLELITLTHSIPEPNAVAVRTPVGTVLHTGDWKFDPDPLIGPTADEAALRKLGDEGVLALIGDSTNALRPGTSGSEADLRRSLVDLIGRYDARVAVACFASNVARLETIARAAAAHGRDVALVGRSLWRVDKAARENGYLTGLPRFLTEDEAGYIPRDRILLICTGSQGEPRSALSRIARVDHPHIVLETGDVAIFSSRIIPGNEKAINRLQNGDMVRLALSGATVVDEVSVGRLASDGKGLLPLDGTALRDRRRVTFNGTAVATLVLDRQGGFAAPPKISVIGVVEPAVAETTAPALHKALERAFDELSPGLRRDDEAVRDAMRRALRRILNECFGKRPLVEIHLVRI